MMAAIRLTPGPELKFLLSDEDAKGIVRLIPKVDPCFACNQTSSAVKLAPCHGLAVPK